MRSILNSRPTVKPKIIAVAISVLKKFACLDFDRILAWVRRTRSIELFKTMPLSASKAKIGSSLPIRIPLPRRIACISFISAANNGLSTPLSTTSLSSTSDKSESLLARSMPLLRRNPRAVSVSMLTTSPDQDPKKLNPQFFSTDFLPRS